MGPTLGKISHADRWIAAALGLFAFLLYLRTLAPGVLDGDSGEWQYLAPLLGVAHSTGYPLYLFLAKFFTLLVPAGSFAFRVNLFSSLCAALAVALLFWLASRMTGRLPAIIASALVAVAPMLWASAVEAEVYAFNTLLCLLVLWLAYRYYLSRLPRDLMLLAFCFGLALDNHRVALFLLPGFGVLLWFCRASLAPSHLLRAACLIVLPLLLYLYIPLRANALIGDQTPANWALYPREDAILKGTVSAYYRHSPDGFMNLITALDNRSKLGFQDQDVAGSFSGRVERTTSLLFAQFNWGALFLVALGGVTWARRELRMFSSFLAMALGVGAIAFFLRGDSTQFYYSTVYSTLALCFAFGCQEIVRLLHSIRLQPQALSTRLAWVLLALIPLTSLAWNWPRMDESNLWTYNDYAVTVLNDGLAPNSVVVAPWEIATALRYFQFAEGRRTDLLIIHDVPTQSKFYVLLDNARKVGRPFYWVEFSPEDRLAPGPRLVQAIPLPLPQPPSPQHTGEQKVVGGVTLVGYDLIPVSPRPGQLARIALYYRVDAASREEFTAELSIDDLLGHEWGNYMHLPVTQYYPTYLWQKGDYFRDTWYWQVPASAPAGLYTSDLSWSLRDSAQAGAANPPQPISLGPFRVGQQTPPNQIEHPQVATLGNVISFLGYDFGEGSQAGGQAARAEKPRVRAGASLSLSLYWRADSPPGRSYTVFLHLLDPSGRLVSQIDAPPWGGLYPTDRWEVGEVIRDPYSLPVPTDLAQGEYRIEVGLYTPPDLRPTVLEAGSASDHILLRDTIQVTAR